MKIFKERERENEAQMKKNRNMYYKEIIKEKEQERGEKKDNVCGRGRKGIKGKNYTYIYH